MKNPDHSIRSAAAPTHDEWRSRRAADSHGGHLIVVIACLVVLIVWNIASYISADNDRSYVVFPKAGYRNGYDEMIASTPPFKHDFYVYETIKRHFPGGRLIGFDQEAIAFGTHSFGGLVRKTITAYDPNLNETETRTLRGQAVVQRSPGKGVPAVVVVAPRGGNAPNTILVLRGDDGARFFVADSMVPSRYSGIVNGR